MYPDAPRCPECNGYARVHSNEPHFYFLCWFEADRSRGYCCTKGYYYWHTPAPSDNPDKER